MIRRILVAMLLTLALSPAFAADVKISQMPPAAALSGSEAIPGVQALSNVRITPAQLKTYVSASTLTVPKLTLTTPSNIGFAPGPTSATPASIAQTDWLWNNGAVSSTSIGGLWPTPINVGVGFSRTFTSGTADAPQIAVDHLAVNNGSPGDVVGTMSLCYLKTATGSCFGSNIIAYSDPFLTGAKLVGLEIDVQPGTGTTLTGASNGLIVNTWTSANPASAISVNAASGGKWAYGLQCAPDVATYACITMSQGLTNGIAINGSGFNPALIYNAGDYLILNSGSSGFAVKDQAGITNRLTITGSMASLGVPLQLAKVAVASLPTCNAGAEGGLAGVTDATSATFNAAVAGGGSNHIMAYCNGTGWTVH